MTYSFKEIFVLAMSISVAAFLFTWVYIGDIPWLFFLDWIGYGILYAFYAWYEREYKIAVKKGGQIYWYVNEVPT